ncbi:hypothetical protein ACT3CD_03540 [Geofilum sp. OHC36d9]
MKSRSTTPSGNTPDWYSYGGLTHEVLFIEVPHNYIDDFTFSIN